MNREPKSIFDKDRGIAVRDMHGKVITDFCPFAMRGPKFIQLKNGELLCFFSVKYTTQKDEEPGCPVLMRSSDEGETWGEPLLLIYDDAPFDIRVAPIYDELHDELVLLAWTRTWKSGCEQDHLLSETDMIEGRSHQHYWVTRSRDGGRTWSDYESVNIEGIPEEWTIKNFLAPIIGIQLHHQKETERNGRLVVGANHAQKNGEQNEFRAHLILSDDFGKTWRIGAVQQWLGSNESIVVELKDGTLIHNCRNQGGEPQNRRIQGLSLNGGETFDESFAVETLFDPVCHAGFAKLDIDEEEYLFFTAPCSEHIRDRIEFGTPLKWGRRECLTLYGSKDGGRTYKKLKLITGENEFSAYSALYPLQSGRLLCAWETGPEMGQYRQVKYTIYSPEELLAWMN